MATLDQIVQQLAQAGMPALPEGHPVADGKVKRYGPGKKAWYVLHEALLASGAVQYFGSFGEWQGLDNGAQKFQAEGGKLSAAERADMLQRQRQLEVQEEERRTLEAQRAAGRATEQWRRAAATGESEYLARKQLTPEWVRFDPDGTIYVPVIRYDTAQLVGLQKIAPDGSKRFNKGMAKKGAACRLGKPGETDRIALIGEGYATVRSIRMATDEAMAAFIAFDAGNLLEVGRVARQQYPDLHLLFCADDDWMIERQLAAHLLKRYGLTQSLEAGAPSQRLECNGTWYEFALAREVDAWGGTYLALTVSNDRVLPHTVRFENTGLARARAAAAELGNASVVAPAFAARGENAWTDFNDLHCAEGLQVVREQISAAVLAALMPPDARPKSESDAPAPAATAGKPGRKGKLSLVAPTPLPPAGAVGGEDDADAENGAHTWEQDLERGKRQEILPSMMNVYRILMCHSRWSGVIAYDEFTGQVAKLQPPPFPGGEVGEWSDMDDLRAMLWIEQSYRIHPRKDIVMDAVLLAADTHKYHDVRQYLACIEWDGQSRVETWLSTYLRVADSEYTRKVATKWLVACVARIVRPGCKADNVLILEGTQGLYKSTALKILAGEKWFTDAPFKIGDKDGYTIIRGKWIVELGELDSFNKADSSQAKLFFGQSIDRYRPFYGKRPSDVPRQCVFAGTVNLDTYLKDETGNRRYWPVRVAREIDRVGLEAARDQLWAEALHLYRQGVIWWVTEDERPLFELEQDDRYEGDAYQDELSRFLAFRDSATMTELLSEGLRLDVAKWTLPEQRRVGKCMKALGWVRRRDGKAGAGGKREWVYYPPDVADALADIPPAAPAGLPTDARIGDDDAPL
ncbi:MULTISPECIES: VapE domain-containing protein [Cupriavidus]